MHFKHSEHFIRIQRGALLAVRKFVFLDLYPCPDHLELISLRPGVIRNPLNDQGPFTLRYPSIFPIPEVTRPEFYLLYSSYSKAPLQAVKKLPSSMLGYITATYTHQCPVAKQRLGHLLCRAQEHH